MKNIYIFGMGKGKDYVVQCLNKKCVSIIGFIDNYKADTLREFDRIPVIKQDELKNDYDYIIISLMDSQFVKEQLMNQGIEEEKIICFFDFADADHEEYRNIFDSYRWRMELIWRHYRNIMLPAMDNLNYEIYADSPVIKNSCPKIMDAEHTVELLIGERKCLARFGDGEFEIMCGRPRAVFQNPDKRLGQRLREVLHSHLDNLLISIADNYGKLDKYTDKAAEDIRSYLTNEVRQDHIKLLELDRQYYDAYLSRPYMLYRDKTSAADRFKNIRKIWAGQDILIVEGEYTRFGVGNDLVENASSVSRILVPGKNAFSRYDAILEKAKEYGRGKLILAILGPTATVLAYDLAKEDYWIIDIGQLDTEYEWYLRGAEKRCSIPYKYVSEVPQYGNLITDDKQEYIKQYKSEVIAEVS